MNEDRSTLIRRLLNPMQPLPTGMKPSLPPMTDIRAVLFDVYGTLLISEAGEIGETGEIDRHPDVPEILRQAGLRPVPMPSYGQISTSLRRFILEEHERKRLAGIEHPEVDIRDIWKTVIEAECPNTGTTQMLSGPVIEEIALRYELEVNRIWAMPGFPDVPHRLAEGGLRIGIVSNAQFYTRPVMEAVAGRALDEIGFHEEYCSWSFELGVAKPSRIIYKTVLDRLLRDGIAPDQVLVVGNDMLNDVTAAARSGCRTALFAGDRRSLRLRADRSAELSSPGFVLTELDQLDILVHKE